MSGEGTIHSWSIVRRPAHPDLPAVYAVVGVAMAEGWYMMSNLIEANVSDVRIDMPVRVRHVAYRDLHLPFVVPQVNRTIQVDPDYAVAAQVDSR